MPKYITTAKIARDLRKNQTPSEKVLWDLLRNRKLKGFKFLRQHPIVHDRNISPNGFIVADFYCAEKKLIIEVDGKIHREQFQEDIIRDMTMLNKGYQTLRIRNEELVDINKVIEMILLKLK